MATCCARDEKRHFLSSGCTQTYTKGEAKTYFCIFFFAFSNTYSDSSKNFAGCGTKTTFAQGCSEFHIFKEDDCVVQARNSSSRKNGAVEFWRLKAEFTFELLTVTFNYGYITWKLAEDTRKDSSFVLILIDKKFFTSVLSKVIRERILLIRFYWTPC